MINAQTKKIIEIPEGIVPAVVAILRPYYPQITDESVQRLIEAHEGEDEDLLLTRAEVCDPLKSSISTVDRLIKNGDIDSFKIRGSVRVPMSSVKRYIAACRDKSSPEVRS